ncbi:bifunctional 2-polyprenyl-6-hydroxyphenol methylase/3-demethylubiquinol 3-O-methyltransferase UbiG [Frankia sp. Cj3]|uniref:class I SAM-dependent methyltransferase n=1 Tax=Frankia sp. Cj3 TaxID=2880976 RepID=UPI001EF683C7|nr:class I SAM-dependent methyltransferase [Frankia sp. Cj3]
MNTISPIIRALLDRFGYRHILDARWVAALLDITPSDERPRMARWLLSLDARYQHIFNHDRWKGHAGSFYIEFVQDLLEPYLLPDLTVLEFACGPGIITREVARRVHAVVAVDVSRGAIACAQAVNAAVNITYLTPEELNRSGGSVDFAYSFLRFGHLSDDVLCGILETVHRALHSGGNLLMCLDVDGREQIAKMRRSGNTEIVCRNDIIDQPGFGRLDFRSLAERVGFTEVEIVSLGRGVPGLATIPHQYVLTARSHDASAAANGSPGRLAGEKSPPISL